VLDGEVDPEDLERPYEGDVAPGLPVVPVQAGFAADARKSA
jgi:hypothetical protein